MSRPVPKPAPRVPTPRKPLSRSGPVKKRRVSKRFAKRREPGFLAWIRQQPCCICGVPTGWSVPVRIMERRYRDAKISTSFVVPAIATIEAAHIKSRGAGGGDIGNVVPLEYLLHREQHRIGIKSFERKYSIDLTATAAALGQRYRDTVVTQFTHTRSPR